MRKHSRSESEFERKPGARSDDQPEGSQVHPAPRLQLSLRSLFLFVTYFAVASGLAVRFGIGIFVLMNGVLLTWLSYRGDLWWMQTNAQRPKVFAASWLLFLCSLALPAFTMRGCGGAPSVAYGWQAAWFTAQTVTFPFEVAMEWKSDPDSRTWSKFGEGTYQLISSVLMNLPNLMMLLSPWMLRRQQHGKGGVLCALFGCAAVSTWTWAARAGPDPQDLRIGYYIWSLAVTMAFLTRPAGWRTLVALGVLGVAILSLKFVG